MGFWKALRHVYGQTRWQRWWVHKTADVLAKLPKDLQAPATQRLQATGMAPNRQRAAMAFDLFVATYEAKYPKAAECLAQDREVLLAFYDFPAEHWGHIRTTNPIASTFATVPPGPTRPAAASSASPRWPWYANCIRVLPNGGIGYGPRITYQRSCRAEPSGMVSGANRTPHESSIHNS